MIETTFHQLADNTLEKIADLLEKADSGGLLEVDYLNGILNIEIPGGKQYIINKHAPTRQIWLSSPVSGAHHFSHNGDEWVSSGGVELNAVLESELAKVT